MKPIPTTVTPLGSVDLATGASAITQYQRSDVCAVPAAAVVGEAMVAWILAGARDRKFGFASLASMPAISRSVSASFFRSFSISAPRSAVGIRMCTRRSPHTRVTVSRAASEPAGAPPNSSDVRPASAST